MDRFLVFRTKFTQEFIRKCKKYTYIDKLVNVFEPVINLKSVPSSAIRHPLLEIWLLARGFRAKT